LLIILIYEWHSSPSLHLSPFCLGTTAAHGWSLTPVDAPSRRPDYHLNNNDPNKPAQFYLSFHTTYPEHYRGDINLCLDATTLPRSLHQEIINENARDTYLSTIKAKTNLEGWSTENGTWK